MCEFAKRYLYNQEEVTPFPISSVLENRGDVGLLVSTLTGEMRKGLIPSSGIPGAIGGLSRVFRRSHKVTRDLVRKARDAELSMHLIQG